MIQTWQYIDWIQRGAVRVTISYLNKRLARQDTIDWALKLTKSQRAERLAVEYLLDTQASYILAEPWATAWRRIEEYWSSTAPDEHSSAVHEVKARLRAGDRSGAVITAIVNLVAPYLKVEPIDASRWLYVKKPRVPKTAEDIINSRLYSGSLIDLAVLDLNDLGETDFLRSIANGLESAVIHGVDIARRLGWDESQSFLGLGMLNRAYYTRSDRPNGAEEGEVDSFSHGIAPSVKLLHSVVSRIADLEPELARAFVRRWGEADSPVFTRLWAAMARSDQMVDIDAVMAFFHSLETRQFWDLHQFPEISELRASRFNEFDLQLQKQIVSRLKKGPPRSYWPRKVEAAKVRDARLYWAIRELRRIEVAGGALPALGKIWLDARLPQFAALADMPIDEGYPGGVRVTVREPQPSEKYDAVSGVQRLKDLEAALGAGRRSWEDDPSARASDWINLTGSAAKVLSDLEVAEGGDGFPRVWNRLGWAHKPPQQQDHVPLDDARVAEECAKVLSLMTKLSDATLSASIDGVCAWLDTWSEQVVVSPLTLSIWLRLWPIAVEATNRKPEEDEGVQLSAVAPASESDSEPMDFDTLNTPAGKLVGVFLTACPNLDLEPLAFAPGSIERQMRDTVVSADGRSGLIARYRMIGSLRYFLRADYDWANEYLIAPLLNDDGAALTLWRAVARRTHFTEVLKVIGGPMAERVNDPRIGLQARGRLAFSLVVESLHAFREGREPAVANSRIQQMLRTLDEQVRGTAAGAIQAFIRDLSQQPSTDEPAPDPEGLFRSAAEPFLRQVWPQERSLVTSGVSRALADLPATSGEAFADAVETIARFLVPFECWSMVDYGLYGDVDDGPVKKLAVINTEVKARALLKLLDLTIGEAEGSVIPHDLTDALDQISRVDPGAVGTETFRRLATAARR
jgi:hypothetical protein